MALLNTKQEALKQTNKDEPSRLTTYLESDPPREDHGLSQGVGAEK